ncbi:BTAD domain-containing putative transcriptional regulator [Acrocarpospora phusangensis]|uniref:BTAD domain-containing putative transcriptional regulator n=1 Tax=Acrocarpospora phusangensis TaxID=1070424 RepID=UPI001950BB1D|nr:BTAD domain-containing putative transcriptional regulator [Acrocarpospora phusangensis]
MRFSVLGPLIVRSGGVHLEIKARQQRAVLSRLILADGIVVSTDALIDAVWGASPAREAVNGLHALLTRIRRAIEPDRPARSPATVLVREPSGYALRVARDAVDSRRFTAAIQAGREHLTANRPAQALTLLDAGLAEWRGAPYMEFAAEGWAAPEVTRLEEVRLVAVECRFSALLELGRTAEAVPGLEGAVREQPLREELWRLLALGLYRSGRQADALAAVRRARDHLAEELGVDPGPGLRGLEAMLLTQDEALLAPEPPSRPLARLSGGGTHHLAGRVGPLAALLGVAGGVTQDRPGYALISGEAGVGKTWLAERLAESLADQGWQVAWGRSGEAGGRPALWPWTQALAALGVSMPEHEERALPDAAEARFRRHAGFARLLAGAAATAPCLVIMDDVQWADDASLRLFADLLTMATAGRLCVTATLRTGEPEGRELAELLSALTRAGAARIELSGLSAAAIRSMADTSRLPLSDRNLDRLMARTGGNALFVQETLRLAAAEGIDAALAEVPSGVANVIRRRVSRLDGTGSGADGFEILTAAAVIGHGEDVSLLAAITGSEPADVLVALDVAISARLLTPGRAFIHDLVRQTVYTGLPSARRAALDLAAADALAARPGADPESVAAHYLAASPLGARRAVDWARTAALVAQGQLAYDDAAGWWGKAAAAHAGASLPDLSERAELLLSEVAARLDAGDISGARRARNRALRVAEAAGEEHIQMRALVAVEPQGLWQLKDFDEIELQLVRRLESALRALPEQDYELRCRLLGTLGMELYDTSAEPRCDALTAEAIALARRIGEPRLLAFALHARALAISRPAGYAELMAISEEQAEIGDRHGLPAHSVVGRMRLALMAAARLSMAEADRYSAECDAQIRRLGLRLHAAQQAAWHVTRLAVSGRFDAALRAVEEAWERMGRLGLFSLDQHYTMVRCFLLIGAGRAEEITDKLIADSGVGRMIPAAAHDFAIVAAAARGETDRVAELAATPWMPLGDDWTLGAFLALRAAAVVAAGDRVAAEAVHAQLRPYSGHLTTGGSILTLGPADLHLARLALLLGRREEAENLLRSCVAAAERERLTWWAEQARAVLRASLSQ